MTVVSRLQLDHPVLGAAGGAGLHASVQALYQKIGDNMADRLFYIQNLNTATTTTLEHNFKVAFADLRLDLYTWNEGTGELTRVTSATSPALSQFTIAATAGFVTTKIDVTNSTGSQQDLALVVLNDPINMGELVDVDFTVAPQDGEALVFNSATSKFNPGAASGGSGRVNYLTNGSFASSTTGWVTYADAAAATPADGTGGSPVSTFTRNTTTPLNGTGDGKLAKSAANRQGEGVAYAFTVPSGYRQGRKSEISFLWDGSAAGYVDGDVVCYIYDVTNSVLITPTITALPKAKGPISFAWDQSTASQYRLIFHVATVSATAYDVFIDDVVVGPGSVNQGAALNPWKPYTPTWTGYAAGTGASSTGYWRQVGDSMEVIADLNIGTGAGDVTGTLTVALPSGYTIDSSKIPTSATFNAMGTILGLNNAGSFYQGVVERSAGNTLDFVSDAAAGSNWGATTPVNWSAGSTFSARFTVPITEWANSGTVNLATNENMGMPLVYKFTQWNPSGTGAGVATNPTAATTQSNNTDIAIGTITSGTQTFTFNKTGKYLVTLNGQHIHAAQTYNYYYINTTVGGTASRLGNGADVLEIAYGEGDVDGNSAQSYALILDVTASGQTFTVQPTGTSDTLGGTAGQHTFNFSVIIQPLSAIGQAVGFGLATATQSGLAKNRVAATALVKGDLTSPTNITIDAGSANDVGKWKLRDDMVSLHMKWNSITIAATNTFSFILPSSIPAPSVDTYGTVSVYDNNGVNVTLCQVGVSTGRVVTVYKPAGANFTGGTNTSFLYGQLSWMAD